MVAEFFEALVSRVPDSGVFRLFQFHRRRVSHDLTGGSQRRQMTERDGLDEDVPRGSGFDRPIFHVEGGIGLFGSASTDSVGIIVLPRP